MKITNGLIEQHIHGAFGVDFMTCSEDELLNVSEMLPEKGVAAFFPVIMTDNIELIKERIQLIKKTMKRQKNKSAKIIGVHLEGPFINPEKTGIHEKKYILPLEIELFKRIEDNIIKIVTIAPELDFTGEFIKYLKSKNIKISAGHCLASDLSNVNQVAHLYNAMGQFSHKNPSTALSSLINNNIYTEIIADSYHVIDDVLKLTFKIRPENRIILISDALPLAHSSLKESIFAGQKIYNKSGKLVNEQGTLAGSSYLLCDIIKNLTDKQILNFDTAYKMAALNLYEYHNLKDIKNSLTVYWNDFNEIEKIEFN